MANLVIFFFVFFREEVEKRFQEIKELFNPVEERIYELKGREALSQMIDSFNQKINHAFSPEVSCKK